MSTYFKAVRPAGTDFYTDTIDYAAALGGGPVTLPEAPNPRCCTSTVLHASTVPAETLIGGSWPCRLFEVTGTPVAEKGHKRGFFSLTVVREVDAHQALGPQGEQVAALIDRAGTLTVGEAENLDAAAASADRASARDAALTAARDAARDAAGVAARDAAWIAAWAAGWDASGDAARDASGAAGWDASGAAGWDASGDAARDAALALVVRDLISKEHYDLLAGPWAQVIGPAHPDDTNPKRGRPMTSTRKALQSVVAQLAEVIDQLPADPSQPRRFDSLADIPEGVERVAGKYLGHPCELARSPLPGTGWMMRIDPPYARQQWAEYMDLREDRLTDIKEVIDHE